MAASQEPDRCRCKCHRLYDAPSAASTALLDAWALLLCCELCQPLHDRAKSAARLESDLKHIDSQPPLEDLDDWTPDNDH